MSGHCEQSPDSAGNREPAAVTVSPCCEVCGGVCGVGGVKCVGCVEWVYCVGCVGVVCGVCGGDTCMHT